MSAAGDSVDVSPVLSRSVKLFHQDGRSAWEHFADHVCNHGDEWEGWCLLLPRLDAERANAGTIQQFRDLVRNTSAERASPQLQALYRAYLRTVQDAIEKGVRMGWYWTTQRGGVDTCWHTFSPCGVRGIFDEEVVRTGHLPRGAPYGQGNANVERHYLFLRCLRKVRDDYRQADRRKEVSEYPSTAFIQVMSNDPGMMDWQALCRPSLPE